MSNVPIFFLLTLFLSASSGVQAARWSASAPKDLPARPQKKAEEPQLVRAARVNAGVEERCQELWPRRDLQKKLCLGVHEKGARQFVDFAEALINQPAPVQSRVAQLLQKCAGDWWDKHGYNYAMVMYCLGKSTRAGDRFW